MTTHADMWKNQTNMVVLCKISLLSATESRPAAGETETDLTDGLLDKSPSNTDRYISTEDDEDSAELHYNITHLNRISYHQNPTGWKNFPD